MVILAVSKRNNTLMQHFYKTRVSNSRFKLIHDLPSPTLLRMEVALEELTFRLVGGNTMLTRLSTGKLWALTTVGTENKSIT